jgi:hypothetical protein
MPNPIPYIPSTTNEIPASHCCAVMTHQVQVASDPNNKDVCPIVCYSDPVRYGIWDQDTRESSTGIFFCPWCGTPLPGCERAHLV